MTDAIKQYLEHLLECGVDESIKRSKFILRRQNSTFFKLAQERHFDYIESLFFVAIRRLNALDKQHVAQANQILSEVLRLHHQSVYELIRELETCPKLPRLFNWHNRAKLILTVHAGTVRLHDHIATFSRLMTKKFGVSLPDCGAIDESPRTIDSDPEFLTDVLPKATRIPVFEFRKAKHL